MSSRSPNTTSRSRSSIDPKIVIDEPADLADLDPTEFTPNAPPSLEGLNAEVKETRLFFGNDLFGTILGGIQPWASGEEPVHRPCRSGHEAERRRRRRPRSPARRLPARAR